MLIQNANNLLITYLRNYCSCAMLQRLHWSKILNALDQNVAKIYLLCKDDQFYFYAKNQYIQEKIDISLEKEFKKIMIIFRN